MNSDFKSVLFNEKFKIVFQNFMTYCKIVIKVGCILYIFKLFINEGCGTKSYVFF